MFAAIKLVERDIGKRHISADIGCHSFATFAPFSLGNSILGYGMSLASSAGVAPMLAGRSMAIMGDGGFWHNGFLSGVASNLLNGGDAVLLIMKNGYTSATGTQELVSSPRTSATELAQEQSPVRADRTIENTLRGVGVKWLRNVYTYRVADMAKTLREAFTTDEPGLKVIVAEGECQLERQRRIRPMLARLLGSGAARGAHPLRRGRRHLLGRPFLHPALGLPLAHAEGVVRPAQGRPGGARQPRLRRLRPVRRSRARRDPVPVVLPRRDRAEPGRLGPLHRAPARGPSSAGCSRRDRTHFRRRRPGRMLCPIMTDRGA